VAALAAVALYHFEKTMNKIFLLASVVAATSLASCSKNTETIVPETDNADGPKVRLTLGDDAATRAFFDDAAKAETWEKDLKTLTVYAFDSSGDLIFRRYLNSSDVSAKSATFLMPNSAAGTTCSFYVVANTSYGDVATTSAMDAMLEKVTLDEYNGPFGEIMIMGKRKSGFVMTGKTTAAIAPAGLTSDISVVLRRTVAKIAVQANVQLSGLYKGSSITINSMKLSKVSALSNSFYMTPLAPRSSLWEYTQTTSKNGSSSTGLFYIYENDALSAGSGVTLTLTGTFDIDGNASTTNDRSDVEYILELTGAGDGEFRRNGYYRVNIVIKEPSGNTNAVTVSVTASDWETPVTQDMTFGN
jgi:hypothetical protein